MSGVTRTYEKIVVAWTGDDWPLSSESQPFFLRRGVVAR